MATDALAGAAIELPADVVAAMAAELPDPLNGSPLKALGALACEAEVHWQRTPAERGLTESGELVPWLVRAMSVLMWPEALVRTRDTAVSDPVTRFVAADTLVRYGQAQGICVIGHPIERDAFVDELVALSTSTMHRPGEPAVLELTKWTLLAIETVLGTDLTRAAAHASLASLTSDLDGPEAIIAAMLTDELLLDEDVLAAGPALKGWHDAFNSRCRLEIQRLDLADGPDEAHVRTMVFIGTPGDRCLIVPRGGDDILLVKPTTDEATVLMDAFLTPGPAGVEHDDFSRVTAAWRVAADALIGSRSR